MCDSLHNLGEAIVGLLILLPQILAKLEVLDVVEQRPQDAVREAVVVSLFDVSLRAAVWSVPLQACAPRKPGHTCTHPRASGALSLGPPQAPRYRASLSRCNSSSAPTARRRGRRCSSRIPRPLCCSSSSRWEGGSQPPAGGTERRRRPWVTWANWTAKCVGAQARSVSPPLRKSGQMISPESKYQMRRSS